jgi:hypothetical protein
VNTEKYPPSLLFLLMTLGPALALLALFDRVIPPALYPLQVIGRVPLFFYLIPLPAIALLRVAFGLAQNASGADRLFSTDPPRYVLWAVYLAWALVVLGLYPLCSWFARLKERRRGWWMGFI